MGCRRLARRNTHGACAPRPPAAWRRRFSCAPACAAQQLWQSAISRLRAGVIIISFASALLLSPFFVIIFGSSVVYATNLPNLFGLDLKEVRFLFKLIGYVVFYLILVGTLSVMYKYIPAVKVEYRYAFRSALIAGVIFMLFQYLYLHTQMFVGRLTQAYGILAAIPLFLIWLNFSWQIIIYGAQLTYSFQNVDQYNVSEWDAESKS